MIEPTERSIPPARITKASPTAVAALKAKLRATFIKLTVVKNRGVRRLTKMTRSTSDNVTPNS